VAPKIVKKEQKRQEIAKSALLFIEEFGIEAFSTSALIKYMGIGKSSLYHYFESKEEILYETFYLVTLDYVNNCKNEITDDMSLEDKLEIFFDFYLVDSKENLWFRTIYLEYLKIFVDAHTDSMKEYNLSLFNLYETFFRQILQDGINKGEIKPEAINFAKSMILTADGMLIYSFSIEEFDLSKELRNYLESLMFLLKAKKC